jgi:hypothetical protein
MRDRDMVWKMNYIILVDYLPPCLREVFWGYQGSKANQCNWIV